MKSLSMQSAHCGPAPVRDLPFYQTKLSVGRRSAKVCCNGANDAYRVKVCETGNISDYNHKNGRNGRGYYEARIWHSKRIESFELLR